jgi:Uma2 family endonuclease
MMLTTALVDRLTLDDFLALDLQDDRIYELEQGQLRSMPTESDLNLQIASLMFAQLLQLGIPPARLRIGTEIVVQSDQATVRRPDLVVLSEGLALALAESGSSTVMPEFPTPELVVEVVSPGKENADRDYRYKRSEYAVCGIREYWIVDPGRGVVSVLEWVDGFYEVVEFVGGDRVVSPQFGDLGITVSELLALA